ncbi:TVP38/TMEM64 family protein [Pseudidiomarina insulisalsae]|uniref:TVP38/TMEM64 family membrane protein n=1 Tax=Pseudidiomarina insulisalsae TaxID=575789 RepID=A0A432YAG0_9GAMM|nr:VTT domain-containing protein [Pseudidiomarina insulisalsae]RUO57927.1 hypothetical protein CWI71_10995 [Pseudidiomarina insulisalsae]
MQKIRLGRTRISPAKLARWQIMGALILISAAIILAITVSTEQWQSLLQNLLKNQGWAASLTLTGVYILAVILMLPLSPFALTAGLFFGFLQGSVIALIAVNVGALISFLITRHWLTSDRFVTVFRSKSMRLLTSGNIRIISLLRLNPLVPFSLHNYLYGAARTELRPYLWGTFLGSAPFTLALVYFGVTGRVIYSAGDSLGPWQYSMIGLGIVLSFALLILTKYAKSASYSPNKESR